MRGPDIWYADVYNHCSTTKRIKVIWAYFPDSPCVSIKPGRHQLFSEDWPAVYAGISTC